MGHWVLEPHHVFGTDIGYYRGLLVLQISNSVRSFH